MQPISIFPPGFIFLPGSQSPFDIRITKPHSLTAYLGTRPVAGLYTFFCSALILIHALECQNLKGRLHFHFSDPVSISTLIVWVVFNIVLLWQAIIFYPKVLHLILNKRMLTQRFLFVLFCFYPCYHFNLTWEKQFLQVEIPILGKNVDLFKKHIF